MKSFIVKTIVLSALVFSAACTNSSTKTEEKAAEETTSTVQDGITGMTEAANAMKKAAEEMQNNNVQTAEPVDFRKLKELMPAKVGGMDRTEHTGEKSGAMGIKFSTAKSSYRNNDKSISLSVMDYGGITGIGSMVAAWAFIDVDKESDTGYEKSGTYKGYKSFEKYDNNSKNGEISILVADRFIVNANGNNVEMNAIKNAVDELNLSKLASLK